MTEMNISYSFTAPESLLIVAMIAVAMLFAVWVLMLIDLWKTARDMRKKKHTHDEYDKFIQRKEEVERKARRRL